MTDLPETEPSADIKALTEAQWAEAKGLYETGKMTKADLSKQFGVHRNTMSSGLIARGAVYGAKSKVIEDATVEASKTDTAKLSAEIAGMKEKRKLGIELLDKLQNKVMAEALRDNKPLSSRSDEFRTLNTMIKNAKMVREELWAIYDLNRDPDGGDEIPEFIVSEYTADEVDMINKERLGVEPEQILEKILAEDEEVSDELDDLLKDPG
jgi:DNA-binding beta-propeller fold protein YncE